MKPLFIPLKRCYFEAFERGDKTHEYRRDVPRWSPKNVFPGRPITLSMGYGKKHRLSAEVVSRTERWMDSPAWNDCYGQSAKGVDIEVKLVADRAASPEASQEGESK